jgi:hypothetical protein
MNMKAVIINHANELAKSNMCMGREYDPNKPIKTVAEALTEIVIESIGDCEGIESAELYDFLNKQLGDK